MNNTLLLDKFLCEELRTFSPYYNIPDGSKPFAISGLLTLLSPANNILASALYDKEDYPEQDTVLSKLKMV